MPVVLNNDLINYWNDIDVDIKCLLQKLNTKTESIKFHRVDIAVNNPKNNNKNLYKEYTELPF